MNVQIHSEGLIYRGTTPERRSCCFPRICVQGDRWLCTFRSAPAKESSMHQQTLLTWSDDRGRTWRAPFAPFAMQERRIP